MNYKLFNNKILLYIYNNFKIKKQFKLLTKIYLNYIIFKKL